MHALIIEDEPLMAMHLETVLEEIGFTTFDHAATEAEAVDAATARRPILVTADYRLREGNGVAAVRAIRAFLGLVPVVFVTGSRAEVEELVSGMPVVAKPIAEAEFRERVAEVLAAVRDPL